MPTVLERASRAFIAPAAAAASVRNAQPGASTAASSRLQPESDWFDLCPVGMVLYDHEGTLVRTNPVFDALVGPVPRRMQEAPPELQQLLAWPGDMATLPLQPDEAPRECHAWIELAGGTQRRLRAVVRCSLGANRRRRYMAVVDDRSVEDERDLAQKQIGALLDTAGAGLATFDASSGWTRQAVGAVSTPAAARPTGTTSALHSISRDIVAPESRADYEGLQSALRQGRRAEVRYAIEHPELGRRWLLTRVEPATLASGKQTTSVVTLDVTEQQRSQQRSAQLLREMTTILESTTAGIAYLRGGVLVRCNRRFEAMWGRAEGSLGGSALAELFGGDVAAGRIDLQRLQTLEADAVYETEFEIAGAEAGPRWYSLSVRRTGPGTEVPESIAVVTDVTRMKAQQSELELDIERRRQAEARMSEAQSALQQVIAAAPLAIALLDARSLAVLQVNAVAAQAVGRSAEALVGCTPEQIFSADVVAIERAHIEQALNTAGVTSREHRIGADSAQPRIWDTRYVPLAPAPGLPPDRLLLVATDVSEQRAAQEARFAAAMAQRDMLVREVHHRIKNNLQGVAGLLQQTAARKPEVASTILEVVGQVQAIAEVYGLQVGARGPLEVSGVVAAICASVERNFGQPIGYVMAEAGAAAWSLPEAEAIPVALILNELLTNAVKHSPLRGDGSAIACELACDASSVRITISNGAQLPAGFDVGRIAGGVSGLGLVRALLPRRNATFGLAQHNERVVASIVFNPPVVVRVEPAPPGETTP